VTLTSLLRSALGRAFKGFTSCAVLKKNKMARNFGMVRGKAFGMTSLKNKTALPKVLNSFMEAI
jgi:hypothetical protein